MLGPGEQKHAFIAGLKRASIDICYYFSGEWTISRWAELRLQNNRQIDIERLQTFARGTHSPKITRGVSQLIRNLQEPDLL